MKLECTPEEFLRFQKALLREGWNQGVDACCEFMEEEYEEGAEGATEMRHELMIGVK